MRLGDALCHAAVEGLGTGLPLSTSAHRVAATAWLPRGADLAAVRAVADLGALVALALVALPRRRAVRTPAPAGRAHLDSAVTTAVAMVVATALGTSVRAVLAPWPEVPAGAGLGLLVTALALVSTALAPPADGAEPSLGWVFVAALGHGLAPLLGAAPAAFAFTVLSWGSAGGWRAARLALAMTAAPLALELRHASVAAFGQIGALPLALAFALGAGSAALAAFAWRWLCLRRRTHWLGVWLLPLGLASLAYDRATPDDTGSRANVVRACSACRALTEEPIMRVYAVVMAGGSGTRFWPASRKRHPKQFLPLGGSVPLLRATCERLLPIVGWEGVRIATGAELASATLALLPELSPDQLFVEPCARNTAPALAWSAWVIARREPEAVIIAAPSDAFVADPAAYLAAMRVAVASAASGAITTIGIEPTRPETGYGYLERGAASATGGAYAVARFVEKPDAETAAAYLASGRFAWNAGIFVYRAGDLCREVRAHLPALAAELDKLDDAARADAAADPGGRTREAALVAQLFPRLPAVSIDKGVMEKAHGLAVVPAAVGWSDVGSWLAASELLPRDATGSSLPEGTVVEHAHDNAVFDLRPAGSAPRQVALVGVSGLIVVDTGDALLVVAKDHAQDVRDIVAALEASGRGAFV